MKDDTTAPYKIARIEGTLHKRGYVPPAPTGEANQKLTCPRKGPKRAKWQVGTRTAARKTTTAIADRHGSWLHVTGTLLIDALRRAADRGVSARLRSKTTKRVASKA
jgi:hypothetical protein